MKNMKKFVALFAIVAMLGTLCVPVMASETPYSIDFTQMTAFANGETSVAMDRAGETNPNTLAVNDDWEFYIPENAPFGSTKTVSLDGGFKMEGKTGEGGSTAVGRSRLVNNTLAAYEDYVLTTTVNKSSVYAGAAFEFGANADGTSYYQIFLNSNKVVDDGETKTWVFKKVVDGEIAYQTEGGFDASSGTAGKLSGDVSITVTKVGGEISWTIIGGVNGQSGTQTMKGSYTDAAPLTGTVAYSNQCNDSGRSMTVKSLTVTPGAPETPGVVGSLGTVTGTEYAIDFKNVTSLALPDGTTGTSYTGVKATAAEVGVDADWKWVNAGISTGGQGGIAIDAENGGLLLTAAPISGASFNEPTSPKVPRLVFDVVDAIPDAFTFNVTINKASVQNGVIVDFLRHNNGQNYYQLYLPGKDYVPEPATTGGNYPAALLYRVENDAVVETVVYDTVENPANHTASQPNYNNRFCGVDDVTVTVKDGKVTVTVEGERNKYGVDAEGAAVNKVVTATLETTNAFATVSAKDTQVAIGTIKNGDWSMNVPGFTMGAAVADGGSTGGGTVTPPVDPEQPGEGGEEGGDDPVVPPVSSALASVDFTSAVASDTIYEIQVDSDNLPISRDPVRIGETDLYLNPPAEGQTVFTGGKKETVQFVDGALQMAKGAVQGVLELLNRECNLTWQPANMADLTNSYKLSFSLADLNSNAGSSVRFNTNADGSEFYVFAVDRPAKNNGPAWQLLKQKDGEMTELLSSTKLTACSTSDYTKPYAAEITVDNTVAGQTVLTVAVSGVSSGSTDFSETLTYTDANPFTFNANEGYVTINMRGNAKVNIYSLELTNGIGSDPVDPDQPGEGGEEGGEGEEGGATGDTSVMNGSNLTDSGLKITAANATYVLDGDGKKTYDITLTYEGVTAADAQVTVLGYVYNTANAGEVPALSGDSAIYAIDQKANSTYGGTVNIKVSEAGARPLTGTTLVVKMGSDDASVTTAQAVLIDLANAKELVAPLVVTAATPAVATVSLGADAAAVAAALPKTVTVTGTRDGVAATAFANVTWDTTGLNTAVVGDVTLTGTLDASDLIDNTAGVTASVTVTVAGLTAGEAVDRGTVDVSKDSDAATVASRIGKVTVKSGDVTDTYTVKAENISAVDTSAVGSVTVTVTVSGESDNKKFNLAAPVTYTVTLNVVEGPVGILGDANADGYVDAMDAVAVANYAFFGTALTDESMADANGDGYVDAMDAVAIANYAFFGTEF